jgi:hypothetical protein
MNRSATPSEATSRTADPLWRVLPGPFVIRVTLAAALVAMVAWVLFTVVFPWVEQVLPFLDASVAN